MYQVLILSMHAILEKFTLVAKYYYRERAAQLYVCIYVH